MNYPSYGTYKDSCIDWLGKVPMHWDLSPLKNVASVNDEALPENTPPDYWLRYVDIAAVDPVAGIKATQEMYFRDAPSRARRRVRHGDVIVSTVRTYLKAITRIVEPEDNLVVSTGFAVLRPRSGLESRFAGYICQSVYFIDEVISRSVGVSYPAINASDLVRIVAPVPPPEEQVGIADFLDRETARIDILIGRYERLISLLQEKRQALISHAVTKGLDPNVSMTDSGVEWLGEMPAHWSVWRNRMLFQEVNERSTTGEEELLTVSHLTGVTPRSEKSNVTMFMAETLEGYKRCQVGDLIINTMWAWMGALGTTPLDGLVSPSYNVYRPRKPEIVDPAYYDVLCRIPSHIVEIRRYSTGVWESRLRLYPDAFFGMHVALPPLSEQHRIVHYLASETAKIDALIAKAREAIALLREHRTSLISAAVTGKIDVSEPARMEVAV